MALKSLQFSKAATAKQQQIEMAKTVFYRNVAQFWGGVCLKSCPPCSMSSNRLNEIFV